VAVVEVPLAGGAGPGRCLGVGWARGHDGRQRGLPADRSRVENRARAGVPYFTAIWAVSNFARPVVLGHFFDSVSRKLMITATYVGSGLLAAVMEVVMLTGSDSLWLFEFCLS